MKKILALVLPLALIGLTGCVSTGITDSFDSAARHYYNHDDEIESMSITGLSKLSLEGYDMNFTMRNIKPQKSILQKNEGVLGSAIKGGTELGKWYLGGRIFDKALGRPQVIETRPEIVNPKVVIP